MITVTNRENTVFGSKYMVFCDLTFGDYQTGGEDLTAEMVGLRTISFADIPTKDGYLFEFSEGKVKVLYPRASSDANTAGVTVSSGSVTADLVDAETPTVTIPASFRSAVDAAKAQEVPDATDLSSVTVRAMFIG